MQKTLSRIMEFEVKVLDFADATCCRPSRHVSFQAMSSISRKERKIVFLV